MRCGRPDGAPLARVGPIVAIVALTLAAPSRAVVAAAAATATAPHADATVHAGATPTADEILIAAERRRGLPRPHTFEASIASAPDAETVTRVEVRSNGFAQQLVIVLEPSRGDAMLSTPDGVWIRPRRLHRLTRVPPELRMFSAASVGDVTAIDLAGTYAATFADAASATVADTADDAVDATQASYRLDLTARRDVRYPRASYTIARDDFRPLRIDFMAASGKVLKTVTYGAFARVFDRVIPTEVVVRDQVHRDGSIVRLSDFRELSPVDPAMFTPDYLLTLSDDT